MQQILNYTPKVERIHHQYQAQGEVNKVLLYEDFYEKSEEAKDKVLQAEESEEKLIKNESLIKDIIINIGWRSVMNITVIIGATELKSKARKNITLMPWIISTKH